MIYEHLARKTYHTLTRMLKYKLLSRYFHPNVRVFVYQKEGTAILFLSFDSIINILFSFYSALSLLAIYTPIFV
jgi:hypothetical protein